MLKGKVAVITGGASGIGEGVARLFVEQGARVVLGDLQVERAQKLASELGAENAIAVECDVRKEEDIERLVSTAVSTFKGLDIMCNNAGIVGKMMVNDARIEQLNTEDYDSVIQVNQRAVVLGTKHAARAMIAAGTQGCIINTASVAGFRVNMSNSGDPLVIPAGYIASKTAVVHLTKLAAVELAPYGIRVNAVAPGSTITPMIARTAGVDESKLEDIAAAMAAHSPLKGIAIMPRDIANGMLYLASDMGRCVNGHTLVIDLGTIAGVTAALPALSSAAAAKAGENGGA